MHVQAVCVKIAHRRGVDAVKGVKAQRAQLDRAGAVNHLVVKGHVHAGGGMGGHGEGLAQVGRRVAQRVVKRQLAARQHHRDVEPLQHEAKRRGRVGHGIGTVGDDNALAVPRCIAHGAGQLLPLLGLYVAAVQRKNVPGLNPGLTGQAGAQAQDVLRRHRRRQAGLGLQAGNGTARGEQDDSGQHEMLLRMCNPLAET